MSLTLLEVAKAKLEGKTVEYRSHTICWKEWSGEGWAEHWEFRIATPPKKKMKFECWTTAYGLVWRFENARFATDFKRIPELDKEVEVSE